MKNFKDYEVNLRLIIVSLWVSMLFIFAYVDIFGFFRAEVLQNALEGRVFIFEVSQLFLFLTTLYIVIPSLMIPATLVLKPGLSRLLNIVIPMVYIVTIAGSMIGEEWIYFLFGSLLEVVILLAIMRYAWKWPKEERG